MKRGDGSGKDLVAQTKPKNNVSGALGQRQEDPLRQPGGISLLLSDGGREK